MSMSTWQLFTKTILHQVNELRECIFVNAAITGLINANYISVFWFCCNAMEHLMLLDRFCQQLTFLTDFVNNFFSIVCFARNQAAVQSCKPQQYGNSKKTSQNLRWLDSAAHLPYIAMSLFVCVIKDWAMSPARCEAALGHKLQSDGPNARRCEQPGG